MYGYEMATRWLTDVQQSMTSKVKEDLSECENGSSAIMIDFSICIALARFGLSQGAPLATD